MKTALVVDDDEFSLRVFRLLLGRSGFEPVEVRTGKEAVKALDRRGGFDVVVCDLKLTDGSGTAFALDLASMSPGVPILLTSGTPIEGWREDELADWEQLAWVAPTAFLEKPFNARTFQEKIESLLAQPAAVCPWNSRLVPCHRSERDQLAPH